MKPAIIVRALAVLYLLCIQVNTYAQEWKTRLPKKPADQLTVKDMQLAFQSWYRDHPIDLKKDKLYPTFIFDTPEEEATKFGIEEYKHFKRWEWYTEPRTYPEGRWDAEKVYTSRRQVPLVDEWLLKKSGDRNPLKGISGAQGSMDMARAPIWSLVGPTNAVGGTNLGRVNCIEINRLNSNTMYIGAPDGGVWKSTNGGVSWVSKFDDQPTISIADIAIDPNDTNTIYVATSDAFGYTFEPFRFWGGTYSVGIMKSTNGGNTWVNTGLLWSVPQNRTIRRLAAHPSNSSILMAATSDGLYRTTNAGATWTQIFATSTYDVEFQHNNGNIVYATTNTVQKSTNAGATFTALSATCAGARYNIEISRQNPNILYTLCTSGTVQRSNNGGVTWTNTASPGVTLYGYYDNILAVSPTDSNTVYVAGFNMRKSTDGGATWASVPTAGHVDNHCIEFFPGSNTNILCGNDGGLFKTVNAGTSWTSLNNGLSITQFYRFGMCRTNAAIMACGAQDNGNMKYNAGTWTNITNADGMENFIDWSNCNTMYAATQNGSLNRSINGGASWTGISTPGGGAWVTPWQQSPLRANTIYAATNRVYKSVNQGTNWTDISGALAGIGNYNNLKVAPSDTNTIYAGNFSKLYRTSNGGTTWTDITTGLPVATNSMSYITVHGTNPSIAYVTFSGFTAGQKVYKTINGGATWTNISGTLPNIPINCVEYQNNALNALYIGTDASVYYINDGLTDWIPYKAGMPNVIIDELEINYAANIIRAATFGRGVWEAKLVPTQDLYIKDRPADNGTEPFIEPNGVYWASEDIWVRNFNDGGAAHQNPICGATNYIYVRVRNRSTSASPGTEQLSVYWAKASSGLGWPNPWNGGIFNCSPPALMGNEVGTQTIPAVPALGSTVRVYAWTPPPPSAYACFGSDQFHFCLLARIETYATPPYGMTYPELVGNLGYNVKQNNNIAWKNVTVATSASCFRMARAEDAAAPVRQHHAMVLVEGEKFSGIKTNPASLKVSVEKERLVAMDHGIIAQGATIPAGGATAPPDYLDENEVAYQLVNVNGHIMDYALVDVNLGKLLRGWSGDGKDIMKFDESGPDGQKITWVRLLTPTASIDGLDIAADEQTAITVRITQVKEPTDPARNVYDFDITLLGAGQENIGGNNFRVDLAPTMAKTNNALARGGALTVLGTEGVQSVTISSITGTTVKLITTNTDRYTMTLLNTSGQAVRKDDFTGQAQVSVKDLPKGVYYMQFVNTRTKEVSVKKIALQ